MRAQDLVHQNKGQVEMALERKIFADEGEEETGTMQMKEIPTIVIMNSLNVIIAKKEGTLKKTVGTKIKTQVYHNVQIVTNLDMMRRLVDTKTRIKRIFMKKRKLMKLMKMCFSHAYLVLLKMFGTWIVVAAII